MHTHTRDIGKQDYHEHHQHRRAKLSMALLLLFNQFKNFFVEWLTFTIINPYLHNVAHKRTQTHSNIDIKSVCTKSQMNKQRNTYKFPYIHMYKFACLYCICIRHK